MRRFAAAFVAIICWSGLAVQFSATFASQQDIGATLWILARYFTVITNLLLALTMTAVMIGRKVSAFLLGGITLSILLVGIVYATLLQGLVHLSSGALVADILLHKASPVAMALWWLFFAPKRALKWDAPAKWVLFPLVYFGYALARGAADGRYPYPFMDVGDLGWPQTLLNAGGVAMGFVLAGFALVWLDRWRPLGSRGDNR
jgi:hypothetical protein